MAQAFRDLGLDSLDSEVQRLKGKVGSYLAVPSKEKGDSIAFWKVCYILFNRYTFTIHDF
jgi:hypothetical protein